MSYDDRHHLGDQQRAVPYADIAPCYHDQQIGAAAPHGWMHDQAAVAAARNERRKCPIYASLPSKFVPAPPPNDPPVTYMLSSSPGRYFEFMAPLVPGWPSSGNEASGGRERSMKVGGEGSLALSPGEGMDIHRSKTPGASNLTRMLERTQHQQTQNREMPKEGDGGGGIDASAATADTPAALPLDSRRKFQLQQQQQSQPQRQSHPQGVRYPQGVHSSTGKRMAPSLQLQRHAYSAAHSTAIAPERQWAPAQSVLVAPSAAAMAGTQIFIPPLHQLMLHQPLSQQHVFVSPPTYDAAAIGAHYYRHQAAIPPPPPPMMFSGRSAPTELIIPQPRREVQGGNAPMAKASQPHHVGGVHLTQPAAASEGAGRTLANPDKIARR